MALRRINEATGQTELIDRPCGSATQSKCPPCAQRTKRLRQAQCREGWHRTDEPTVPATLDDDEAGLIIVRGNLEYARHDCLGRGQFDEVAEIDEAIADIEQMMSKAGLRARSARTTRCGGHRPPLSSTTSTSRSRSGMRRTAYQVILMRRMAPPEPRATFWALNGHPRRGSCPSIRSLSARSGGCQEIRATAPYA